MGAKTKKLIIFLSRIGAMALIVVTPWTLFGCTSTLRTREANPSEDSMVSLLMPSRIEIVEPFTRVRDFNQDNVLDGIELLVQAVNSLGNTGLQIVGNIRIELYEFVEASAEPKGARIDRWAVDLSSVERQQKHWNQLTQMYEFRLEVDPAVLPRKRKFVLTVTYDTPQGVHLMDDCMLEYDVRGFSAGGDAAYDSYASIANGQILPLPCPLG
jgi:hypothetical protein